MKNKYHNVGTNIYIDTPNTQIHDRSLYWLSTGTSIKNEGVKHLHDRNVSLKGEAWRHGTSSTPPLLY